MNIKRGQIYIADLDNIIGSEQGGTRPVLILQNNKGNKYSPTTIVACITTKTNNKAHLPTHSFVPVSLGLETKSIVMLEQIRVIDKKRLDHRIGILPEKNMRGIDKAIKISVGLIRSSPHIPLCLCHTCARNLSGTGDYFLRKAEHLQLEQSLCNLCNHRIGYDYELIKRTPW